ncbi:restriction endonuclease subunit S [Enterococcus casseliflavus]|uniref:restriction endonuclease subunit S n=1 Tax=Enterococcus casseliflavus TaxID=37734 RepID=UPI00201CB6FA|nr:restriction endonuclease subunit S [Enterococcus casseliflavus]MDT2954426.1 restriction endonuclease subunit S [Enterococcus casseliflavus]MDT2957696.1 restriction endonuclease subunit S [Enterococcus casseliflavus]
MVNREMKDSGVEWVGKIPEEWDIQRLKNILIERKENNKPQKTDNILSLMKDRGVIPYSEKGDVGNKSKTDLTQYKLAYPGDIVLNSMNVIIGSVGLSKYFGAVSPVYYMLRPRNSEYFVEYYNYIFQTKVFQKSLIGYGNGIMEHRMRIPMNNLNNVLLPIPPGREQQKIAAFLDDKVAHIDNIIEETKKSIENLKAYKQSLITDTVTKGLNPNVEMKDSGIEWIGKIPKYWKVEKTKYSYKFNKGLSITKADLIDEGIPVINYGEIHSKYGVKFNPEKHIVKKVNPDYKRYNNALLKYGDVIFADTSEDIEGSGNFTTFLGETNCFAGYHTVVLKPIKRNNYIFMTYLFDSLTYRRQVRNMVQGIKVFSITQSILKNTYVWLPPIKEQNEIAIYLENKIPTLDKMISEKEKIIEELKDYKKSLIYEYVTGKKEVK